MSLDEAPRWFYVVAITALVSSLPLYVSLEKRLTKIEEQVFYITKRQTEERTLFLQTMQKIDRSFERLTDAVQSLQVEVTVLREQGESNNARRDERTR